MPFSLIKISLIIVAASHIAIAGPVPDVLGSAISERAEQVSGGSVYNSNQGDSSSGLDLLELLSGNGGNGGEVHDEKPASHNKDVGGPSLAGTRHRQGNTVGQSAGPFSAFGDSAQGGSVSGSGGGVLNILAGNGGNGGGGGGGLSLLNILKKRNL